MNVFKALMLVAFAAAAAPAFSADDSTQTEGHPASVETYHYGMKLDIQKVISVSEIANECAPVPAQMTYEDSQGKRHILKYQVMGTGCSAG
ncbi:DUF2790 domain-containing protein [Pseudomonas sp. S2_C03]